MTIDELYKWAKENNAENLELAFSDMSINGEFYATFAEKKKYVDKKGNIILEIVRLDSN